jgi:hypothetical protein
MRINGAETANGKSEAQRLIAHRAIAATAARRSHTL